LTVKGSPSRGEARKQAIAEVALEIFIERGFGAATVDHVAQQAGASKQTIYKFFGDRDGLIAHTLGLELETVIAPMREAANADGEARRRLDQFARAYQEVIFAPRCLRIYRYVIGEINEHPELGDAFTQTVTEYVVSLAAPIVGEVTGADAARAAELTDAFIGTLQGTEFNRALAGLPANPARLSALRDAAVAGVVAARES
jgi:TetR/AcrR family transcriptional repressor of mexJK operon